jgi:ribosomal protein L24E
MKQNIPDETPLDQLRICKFCGRVFRDGDTEIELDTEGTGLVEKCPYCGKDLNSFNESEE